MSFCKIKSPRGSLPVEPFIVISFISSIKQGKIVFAALNIQFKVLIEVQFNPFNSWDRNFLKQSIYGVQRKGNVLISLVNSLSIVTDSCYSCMGFEVQSLCAIEVITIFIHCILFPQLMTWQRNRN